MSPPTTLNLDAEALYAALRQGVRGLLSGAPDTALVGIWSGGAWLAARLQADLGLPDEAGVVAHLGQRREDRGSARDAVAAGHTDALGTEIESQKQRRRGSFGPRDAVHACPASWLSMRGSMPSNESARS